MIERGIRKKLLEQPGAETAGWSTRESRGSRAGTTRKHVR